MKRTSLSLGVLSLLSAAACSAGHVAPEAAHDAVERSAQSLTAPGTEDCAGANAYAVQALVNQISMARATALADVPSFGTGSADANAALDALAQAAKSLASFHDWLSTNALSAANASAADSLHSTMDGVTPLLLDAQRALASVARAAPTGSAARVFDAAAAAAAQANALGTTGGRCYMDPYVAAAPGAATTVTTPTSCTGVSASALAPVASLLANASSTAQSDLARYASAPASSYVGYEITALQTAAQALASLQASPANGADPATAASYQRALRDAVASLTLASHWSAVAAGNLASAEARASFELEEQAIERSTSLSAIAGRCVLGSGTLPPPPMTVLSQNELGAAFKAFGDRMSNITNVLSVVPYVGAFISAAQTLASLLGGGSQSDQGMLAINGALQAIYGTILAADQHNLLIDIDSYKSGAMTANGEAVTWIAHGQPAGDPNWSDALVQSLTAQNQLLTNDALHYRLFNPLTDAAAFTPEGATVNPGVFPVNRYVSFDANGAPQTIRDYRVYLPAAEYAVSVRLAVLRAQTPDFSRTAFDASELNLTAQYLQGIYDDIAAGLSCDSSSDPQGSIIEGSCWHANWTEKTGPNVSSHFWRVTEDMGSVPVAAVGAHMAADLAQARQIAEDETGLTALRALIAEVRFMATPVPPLAVSGDFDGNGKSDVALVGGGNWGSVPVAFSNGNGTFYWSNAGVDAAFAHHATEVGVRAVAGDFNGDHRADIALVGGRGWTTQPIAFSLGNGSFRVTDAPIGNFAEWAGEAGAQSASGDYDADGKADIALAGGQWGSVPIAFSKGDGTFRVTNVGDASFPTWAARSGARLVSGRFAGAAAIGTDGPTLALVGGAGWTGGYLGRPQADGALTWDLQVPLLGTFTALAARPTATPLAGDFDADGVADIALVGGDGTQLVVAYNTPPLPPVSHPAPHMLATGAFEAPEAENAESAAATLPIFLPIAPNLAFGVLTPAVGDFAAWARLPGATPLAGDFDGDGTTDVAMTGGDWGSIPVAFGARNRTFRVTNNGLDTFPQWANRTVRPR